MFGGKETAKWGAKEDLQSKFQHIDPVLLGDLTFMICYAVNGCKMRLSAIEGGLKQPDPFIPLTKALDITQLVDRFEVLQTTIDLARVLLTIKDNLPTVACPLAEKLESR